MPLKEFAFLYANFSLRKPFFPSIFQRDWNAKTSETFTWRIRVNAHGSHVYTLRLSFFFLSFLHSTPRTQWQDEKMEEGDEKGWASRSFERELSKKKARNWIHFGDGFKFDERLERELTNNFSLFHLIIWIHSRVDPLEK